jgi:thiol:disulfide interchange protein
MFLFIRLCCGLIFAFGGWQTATGLRQNDNATAWQGVAWIGAGLVIEGLAKWWRARNQDCKIRVSKEQNI